MGGAVSQCGLWGAGEVTEARGRKKVGNGGGEGGCGGAAVSVKWVVDFRGQGGG